MSMKTKHLGKILNGKVHYLRIENLLKVHALYNQVLLTEFRIYRKK